MSTCIAVELLQICPFVQYALPFCTAAQHILCDNLQGSAASAQSLRESFDATNASLQRVVTESNTKQEATKSLNTVAMILSNFLKDPSSDRNRKVNTSGSRFSEIFRNNSAAGELLKLAGFQYQHPNFVFNETGQINAEGAQRTLDLVQEAQRNIDQTWSTRGDRPAAAPAAAPAAPAAAPAAAPVAPAPAPAAAPTPSASSSAEAARPWAPRQPPPGAPQAWVNMTRDINEDPQPPVQAQAQPAQAGPTPAHPAETLPPAIAHPAESEARPMAQAAAQPATQPATQPPQQPSHVAPSQPQHHLPIAHPAEAAPVSTSKLNWLGDLGVYSCNWCYFTWCNKHLLDGEYPINIPSFQPQGTHFLRICFAVSLIHPNVR